MRTPICTQPAEPGSATRSPATDQQRWLVAFTGGHAGNHARADRFATGPAPHFGHRADVARYGPLLVVAVRPLPGLDHTGEGVVVSVEVVDCRTPASADDAFERMTVWLYAPDR